MEENLKLDLSSSSYFGSGDALEKEKKSLDHMNSFQYTNEKIESYVIDMDPFSPGINKDNANTNSRITTQRSLSRKGSQRLGDRKMNSIATLQIHDNKDLISAMCSPLGVGCGTPEKSGAMLVSSTDHSINQHIHQQSGATTGETKPLTRRNSFVRSTSWSLDPKRVLIFFATLSSMGTMLLIYFTLISNKQNSDDFVGDIGTSE
ncbi:uncharacterized protein LOC127138220 [Lathyrus oleraceus]|uniref:uncharacterized protein LOC127138220 n=1 Tax=Pisum sativum TaxID=3888 RepID=UPI0021CE0E54|nr:uncharacterized protein LOC127138220 [Pisum sativum]